MTAAPGDFVGRTVERAQLAATLNDPSGGVVLVAGPAGVGKTRLLTESLRGVAAPVVWGTCWQGDGVPAFWPWLQVLRSCLPPDERAPAGNVSVLLGDDTQLGDATRFAMFERVVGVLRTAGRADGLVVVLDDLHWADEPSIRLLLFATRALGASGSGVRFVGAYRDDEVGPDHPLSRSMGDVAGGVRHVRLRGLALHDLGLLAAAQLGAPLGTPQLSELHALTGGNPFFAREVLALAQGRGDAPGRFRVPPAVHAVIEQRLARLSNTCEDVLKAAAVIGRAFAADDLAAAMGAPLEKVLVALDEAVEAKVVVADDARPGGFRFAHDLLREGVYDTIPPAARAASHARAAAALEARGDVAAATLAHHLIGAVPLVDRLQAVEAARRAAAEASLVHAHEEAAEWLTRALSLVRRDRDEELHALGILLELGEARRRGGDLSGAREAYLDAAGIARRRGRPHDLAAAALGLGAGLGGFEVGMFDGVQIELVEEALRAVEPGDSALRSRLLARLSVALSFVANDDRRRALAAEAVSMARRLGDPSVLGHALAAHCDSIAGPAHAGPRRDQATEIVALGLDAGEPQLELLGRRLLVVALLELGEMAAADAEIRAYSATAEAVREPLYRWYVPLWRGMRALMAGRIAEAEALRREAEALGALAHSVNAAMLTFTQRWVALRVEGKLDEAARLIDEQGAEVFGQISGVDAVRALSHLHVGEHDQARSLLHALTADLTRIPMDAEWLPTIAQLAEVAAGVDDRTAAAVLDRAMAPFDESVVVEGIGAAVYGTLGAYRAPLARLLGREEESRELERAAAAAAERLGLVGRPQVQAPSTSSTTSIAGATAIREGDAWELRFAGAVGRVRDGKGMRDLALLLVNAGREVHVTALTGGADPLVTTTARGDAVLDQRALSEYKRRIDELDAELAEAEDHHDEGRIDRLGTERELLLAELAAATGLGGRHRRLGDDVDRQRKAVWARLRDAIGRIQDVHPELGRHLAKSVRTGTFCAYDPETRVTWTVRS